ncbi:MAG TPA: DUF4198 domain-containing protein [Thermoanaerobaculia bacterium]|nr:DUF4198 domain-containing protein [Thermoanaerobaculia bacterium]
MKRLLLLALLATPLLAHDFWIEPGTRSLRVGEHFEGEPVRGSAPVLLVQRNGAVMLTYQSRQFALHEMPRAKFEQYLQEEGLTRIRPTGGVQRERFGRFAKSLVRGETFPPLGWRFELVPLSASRFQLLYEGKPLADTLVVAMNRSKERLTTRTDAQGTVTFDLGQGAWLIKSVHMVPAPPDSGVTWESLWASLTFEK